MLKLLLTALLVIGAYAAIQPYRTVQNLTRALENEDPAQVGRYVDFDAVKASLNDDFATRMGIDQGRPGTVGTMLATTVAAAFINNIVSPETMVAVLKDKSRRDRMGLSDSLADLAFRGQWRNAHEFILRNDNDQPTALLTRDGLHWQVTALRVYQ